MALVASRYAHAFAEAATGANLDAALAESQLQDFADALAGSAELREAMGSPAIHGDEKLKVLDALLTKLGVPGDSKLVRNFLAVLIDHDRLAFLPEVLADYRTMVEAQQGIAEVEITSAQPLSDESRALLEKKIGEMAGSKVTAQYSEDKSLLGGVIVRLGSTIYDGSVQGRLKRLKQELVQG